MGTVVALAGCPPGRGPVAGRVVDVALVQPPQACLVLAFLCLERRRRVPRTEIADLLWGDTRPASWDAALRGLTGRIRGFLGGCGLPPTALVTQRGFYELHLPADAEVDLERAERLLELAVRALEEPDPSAALALARRAGAILASPLLPAVHHPWLDDLRVRTRERHVTALEHAAAARTSLGQHRGAVAAAAEAHQLLPLRESTLRALMTANYAAGNRADALEAFYLSRQRMRRALGVEPSATTHELFLEILRDDAEAAGPAPPDAAAAPGPAPMPVHPPVTATAAAEMELRALRQQIAADGEAPPSRERARDLIRLCLLARRCGAVAEAEAAGEEAAAIARLLGDAGLLSEAALANATFDRLTPSTRVTGLALVDEALAGLEASPGDAAGSCRAALLGRRAQYLAAAHQGTRAAHVAAELAAHVDGGGPPTARAWALAALLSAGGAAGAAGARDRRAVLGLELFELARGTDPELALLGLEHRVSAVAESGDLDGAYGVMAAYARVAADEGAPWGLFRAQAHRCLRAGAEGRFAEADVQADALARLAAQLGPPWVAEAYRAAALFVPRWLTGRAGDLVQPLRDLAARLDIPQAYAIGAFAAAEGARPEAARTAWQRATAAPEAWTEPGRAWGLSAFCLAGTAVRLGDTHAGARLYRQLLPAADDSAVFDGLIYLGSFQLQLGRLASACGWWELATDHLQTALDRHRRARALPWTALAADALADALEEGGSRRSSARSTALRAEAAELAKRLGMRLPAPVARSARRTTMQACG